MSCKDDEVFYDTETLVQILLSLPKDQLSEVIHEVQSTLFAKHISFHSEVLQ